MRLAFGNCRVRDADELRFLFECGNRFGTDVAHAHLYARSERSDYLPYGTFVRHERLDSFRYRLAAVSEVPLGTRCAFDNRLRARAAVFFESLAVFLDDFSGRFISACKEVAEHDGRCPCRERLGDIP